MNAPALPSLEEVQNFLKKYIENQKKIYENFLRAVNNKSREILTADDPKKQAKLEKLLKKYHKYLKKGCDNLKKQCETGEKLFEDSQKLEKEASSQTIKILSRFQDKINSLNKEWDKIKIEVSLLENEIVSLIPPQIKAQ